LQYDDEAAEEEIVDRQQRVYRGQPNSVGQVARDRDGLRLSVTNIIPVSVCQIFVSDIYGSLSLLSVWLIKLKAPRLPLKSMHINGLFNV
jgi:hypothetical protein